MGCGSWSSSTWSSYKADHKITKSSTVKELYTAISIDKDLDPRGVTMRESCDSDEHPNSNAIILGLDVTGSMGHLAEEIAKGALNDLITQIYDNASLVDPQVMIAGIGDAFYDRSPLQVSQFESDIRIAEHLQKIWFEGGGGGNDGESYLLLYYFAARHTAIDCFLKRNQKGVIYTIGDEPCLDVITESQIRDVFGDEVDSDISFDDIYNEASKMYDIYHICIEPSYGHGGSLIEGWRNKIGEKAIFIRRDESDRIPHIINTTLELKLGKKLDEIISKYDTSTALTVSKAVGALARGSASLSTTTSSDLLEFD